MPRMPDIEAEIRRDWDRLRGTAGHITHASHTPGSQPVTVETQPHQGETMSLATDLRAVADRIEPLGEEALATVSAVLAHPETAPLLATLSQLAGVGLPAGLISEVAGGLTGLAKAYAPQQQAAA